MEWEIHFRLRTRAEKPVTETLDELRDLCYAGWLAGYATLERSYERWQLPRRNGGAIRATTNASVQVLVVKSVADLDAFINRIQDAFLVQGAIKAAQTGWQQR